MASYTQSDNSVIGGTYFQGIIKPWDEYICFSVGDYSSILVVGEYDGISGNTISFKDSTVYRVTRGSSGSFTYTTSVSEESTTTVTVDEPYYIYSNSFTGAPVLNSTASTSIMCYFVCFCCILYAINNVIGNAIRSVIRYVGK